MSSCASLVLVLCLLDIESSYRENIERKAQGVPDTVQFWFDPRSTWRIRTFAKDQDIHVHEIGGHFTPEQAVANCRKHYGDVVASVDVVRLCESDRGNARPRALVDLNFEGVLEWSRKGFAFYNPDRGAYRTLSEPQQR